MEFQKLKDDMMNNENIDYRKIIKFLKNNRNDQNKFPEIYKMTRKFIPKTLYKYGSFTDDEKLNLKKLRCLYDKKIYLSSSEHLNDLFDTNAFYYDEDQLAKFEVEESRGDNIFNNIRKTQLLTCFTSNGVSSMPMWAHYANNHNGYCVSYEMDIKFNGLLRSSMMPVQYIDSRIDITEYMINFAIETKELINRNTQKDILTHIITDMTLPYITALYINLKHLSWSYENEYRHSIGKRNEDDHFVDALPSAIYIGVNCTEKRRKKLIDICDQLDIEAYDMRFNHKTKEFMLKPELVNMHNLK